MSVTRDSLFFPFVNRFRDPTPPCTTLINMAIRGGCHKIQKMNYLYAVTDGSQKITYL